MGVADRLEAFFTVKKGVPSMRKETRPAARGLGVVLRGRIVEATHGRVHDLRIEERDGRIVVHGECGSYHVKQLVLQAILDTVSERYAALPIDLAGLEVRQAGERHRTKRGRPPTA